MLSSASMRGAGLALYFAAGALLFALAMSSRLTGEYQTVWDLQWLNAWLLLLPAILIVHWNWRIDTRIRTWLTIICFSFWAFVAVSLVFHGTPFSWNGYWGDQKFRQAMILKFMTFLIPSDYYYKDLSPHYPPLYYYLLSWYGRIFSVEYFKLLKIGSQLIYLFGPALLYVIWRRLVSRYQALIITLATFVMGGLYYHLPLSVPHEYLSNIVFIPWWLHFVEGIGERSTGWRHYALGGIIGGAAFMSFYYVFFIGGLLITVRIGHWLWCRWRKVQSSLRPGRVFGVLASAALFSAPYWMPLAYSMLAVDNHPSQREWFHLLYADLHFVFLKFSVPGLLTLSSIYYLFRRRSAALSRSLLTLILASTGLYIVGYLLGNMGQPILYIKAGEFLFVLAGPMIGLMMAGLLRLDGWKRRTRGAIGVVTLILVVILGQDFTALAKVKEVETARKSQVQDFGTDPQEMAGRKGSVVLTADETFASFFPVYQFNAINQHYAHNASRYLERHHFLYQLQWTDDPRLFQLALRHNKYDPVDYFMPRLAGGRLELWSNLSRYPDRFVERTMKYSPELVDDTSLFRHVRGDLTYQVVDTLPDLPRGEYRKTYPSVRDSLVSAYEFYLLAHHLDSLGSRVLADFVSLDTTNWKLLEVDGSGDSLVQYGNVYLVPAEDSLALLMAFEACRTVGADYKLFLHMYRQGNDTAFDNFDFLPSIATGRWQLRDVVVCLRMLPSDADYSRIHLGFFRDQLRLGRGWWVEIPPD